jgi:hypothetical protein
MLRTIASASFLVGITACATSSAPPGGGGAHFDSGGGATFDSATGDGGGGSDGGGGGSDSGDHDSGGTITDSGGGSDSVAVGCTWSVSGAATASGNCTADVGYGSSSSQLSIAITSASGFFSFGAVLGNSPSFAPGTWTYAGVTKAGAPFVELPNKAWDMSKGNMSGTTPQGDFTLIITQVGPEFMTDGGDLWAAAHGSVTITMLPSTGSPATGTVNGQITF